MSGDPFAQRWHSNRNDVQAIKQVILKPSRFHKLTQIAVGRRDHSNIDALAALGAEWLDFAFLQNPQQLRLKRAAHGADFIEKDRAAVRERELSLSCGGRVCERPSDMAEQFRLEQRVGNRGTVDFHEWQRSVPCAMMDGAGDQLFARPRFSRDEDRTARRCDKLDAPNQINHWTGVTDNAVRLHHRSSNGRQRDTITREHYISSFSSSISVVATSRDGFGSFLSDVLHNINGVMFIPRQPARQAEGRIEFRPR